MMRTITFAVLATAYWFSGPAVATAAAGKCQSSRRAAPWKSAANAIPKLVAGAMDTMGVRIVAGVAHRKAV